MEVASESEDTRSRPTDMYPFVVLLQIYHVYLRPLGLINRSIIVELLTLFRLFAVPWSCTHVEIMRLYRHSLLSLAQHSFSLH